LIFPLNDKEFILSLLELTLEVLLGKDEIVLNSAEVVDLQFLFIDLLIEFPVGLLESFDLGK